MNVTKPEMKCRQLPVDKSPKEGSPQKNSAEHKGYAGAHNYGRITENNITNADMSKEKLLEKIVDRDNMNNAFKRVKSNKGAHGIDGMENNENSVIYRDIFPGVDIEYKQLADGIKEDIILNTPDTSNHFTFNIKTGGLTPLLHEDNSIGFYTDPKGEEPGEMKFLIPRPYMIDSNHQLSQDVIFQLKETENAEEYNLLVIADYDWLSAS